MSGHNLAQVNIALPREPLDSALLADFVAALDPVNALADAADGFVWRLQTEDGDATAIRAFGDDRLIVNMSVWESLEALRGFVYSGPHLEVMRRRREWFERIGTPILALWWVPAGTLPTVRRRRAARRASRRARAHAARLRLPPALLARRCADPPASAGRLPLIRAPAGSSFLGPRRLRVRPRRVP